MWLIVVFEVLLAILAIFGTAIMLIEIDYQLSIVYMRPVFWKPIEVEYYGYLRKQLAMKYFRWAVINHIPSDVFKKMSSWNKVMQQAIYNSTHPDP